MYMYVYFSVYFICVAYEGRIIDSRQLATTNLLGIIERDCITESGLQMFDAAVGAVMLLILPPCVRMSVAYKNNVDLHAYVVVFIFVTPFMFYLHLYFACGEG